MLRFTRTSKKAADEQQNRSTITDHATRENNIIDWNGVKSTAELDGSGGHSDRQAQATETLDLTLSSTYDMLLLHDSARFHQNDTSRRRFDTVLRKTSVDVETSV